MTEKLPLYVEIDIIAEMNVGNEPGNSIEQIEQFITEQFPDDPDGQKVSSWS